MVLGITGGIATGKSSVAAMFGELGAAVVSADDLARRAVAPGSPALAALVERFGGDILAGDGTLDRAALAAIVFRDAAARADLNRITHPAIAALAEATLGELRASGQRLIVYEAPLLFEAGAASRVDRILVVTADADSQRRRLVARDGIGADEAQARIAAQMPLAEKVRRADHVIDNSGPPERTRTAVEALYRELLRIRSQ